MRYLVQLAGVDIIHVQDLGSSPRSVLFSIIFCKTRSHAVTMFKSTVRLPGSNIHVPLEIRSRAED